VNIFYDQLLIKEPGTVKRTPWHHDMPSWPLAGWQVCTIWLALDPVTEESGAVEYVRVLWRSPHRPSLGERRSV
jgi:ectoine hydroxylase-related dioxygenase (phytanoyl-CoA dioxygenase family)